MQVAAKVFSLMRLTDARKTSSGEAGGNDDSKEMQQLEQAYLYLMEEFRKAYLADQVQKDSKVMIPKTPPPL